MPDSSIVDAGIDAATKSPAAGVGAGALATALVGVANRVFRTGPRFKRLQAQLNAHAAEIAAVKAEQVKDRDFVKDAVARIAVSVSEQSVMVGRIDERTNGVVRAVETLGDQVGQMQRTLMEHRGE